MTTVYAGPPPPVLYGRTDIDNVSIQQPDGSWHKHERTKKMASAEGKPGPFVLECKSCITKLIDMDPGIITKSMDPTVQFTTHWSTNVRTVPKSEGEKEAEEDAEREFMLGNMSDFEAFKEFRASRRRGPAINVAR